MHTKYEARNEHGAWCELRVARGQSRSTAEIDINRKNNIGEHVCITIEKTDGTPSRIRITKCELNNKVRYMLRLAYVITHWFDKELEELIDDEQMIVMIDRDIVISSFQEIRWIKVGGDIATTVADLDPAYENSHEYKWAVKRSQEAQNAATEPTK